jgi:chemotaxis protein histidine kinase CheA
MDEILEEFTRESKDLIEQMTGILESVEEDPKRFQKLEDFGQTVDRIMGGAKSIAMGYPPEHATHVIANYCELCKLVSYKASQIPDNPDLTNIVTALLLDATETLEQLTSQLENHGDSQIKNVMTTTFLDRLKWVATKFDENLRASVAITTNGSPATKSSTQQDIDQILKQLGLS